MRLAISEPPASPPPLSQGYLKKPGMMSHTRFWFVLESEALSWFADPKDVHEPKAASAERRILIHTITGAHARGSDLELSLPYSINASNISVQVRWNMNWHHARVPTNNLLNCNMD